MEPAGKSNPSQPAPAEVENQSAPAQLGNEVAAAFVAEARSIQALLQQYKRNSEALKSDLSGFVHREIDEHAKLAHLRALVNQAELNSLRDSRYMEYIARKNTHHADTIVAPMPDACASTSLPSANVPIHSSGADAPSLNGVWWMDALQISNSSLLRAWLPDAGVSLQSETIVAQVWLGWRTANAASTDTFHRFADKVYGASAERLGSDERALICFGNGLLCTLPAEVDPSTLARMKDEVSSTFAKAMSVSRDKSLFGSLSSKVALAASAYSTTLHEAVAMTHHNFSRLMWPSVESGSVTEPHSAFVADGLRLAGDAWDTLTFVEPARLRDSVSFRGFFFQGKLGLVEQLGCEVDVTPLFSSAAHSAPVVEADRTDIRSSVVRTLRSLYVALTTHAAGADSGAGAAELANLVLTVALRTHLDREGFLNGVLLDVHPVTPQLPFEGRTTWMEVCAVGKQCGATRGSTGSTGVQDDGATEDVVFRLTYLPVASLQPYDTVSRQIFPLLNEIVSSAPVLLSQSEKPADDVWNRKVTSPFSSAPIVATTTICVGALCCAAVAVVALRRVYKK